MEMVEAGQDGSEKQVTRSNRASLSPKKNTTLLSTTKRLPWLDNKTSRAVHVIPLDGQISGPDPSSPSTRPTSRKPSIAFAPKRVTTTTSIIKRKPVAPPKDARKPSVAGSSPSPVTQYRTSQIRRTSTASKPPSITGTIRRAPASIKATKRNAPRPRPHNSGQDRGSSSGPRPRTDSVVPVPDHLERRETPESIESQPEHNVRSITPSAPVVSRVQVSPTQPAPGRTAFERNRDRKISNAVDDLEDMVQEAVEIADETADHGQVEEIYGIIEEARNAIQDASGDPRRHLMSGGPPLEYPEPSTEVRELSGSSLRNSRDHQRPPYPKRSPPLPPLHSGQQRDSASFDWAYPDRDRHHYRSPTVSLSSDDRIEDRRHSTYSTASNLLLPPPTVQATARDHVDLVLRPRARDPSHSRGRSRRRVTGDSSFRPRRRHHRKSYEEDRSTSHSKHRKHRRSDYSRGDTSFDEEDSPTQRYATELTVHDSTHRHTFSRHRQHRRQPIARNWSTGKKRFTATIACINTALLGIIIGVYAGEVPRIQYYLADERHISIVGNVVFYFGLAISTFIAWPLPLLHGRKPYILAALAIALPLQFPQAIVVSARRSPTRAIFRIGLLCARAASGLVLGFANVNYITVLLDLFGASLQSKYPHQEYVVANDVRRHGGGMGMWLGIWSWCWIGSLAVGFQVGAAIIESLSPDWGFYVVVVMLAAALVLNIMAPETRRAPHRRSVTEVYDHDENYITRRVERGEVKLHIATEGPLYWFEEVWAGIKLMSSMLCQPGFLVLAVYLAWIYAQIVLVIILLGALLSRNYKWQPRYVGLGVISIAIGAFLAIPLTKASIFSRDRKKAFRTDSMTFQSQISWSSHLVRRSIFTLVLPLMGLAYTVSSTGAPRPVLVPIVFAGAVGFLSLLAIAECTGLIMETFDTCDLQPGVNTRHRFQSLAVQDQRRRTNYSSFPRVTAGIFAAQILAFVGAAVATAVGGSMTRRLGAQASTGVTAGILLGMTVLLTLVLVRVREIQVIPNHTFGTRRDTAAWQAFKDLEKVGKGEDWKAVVIGNPSGKMRRMNVLELGGLSRWTEIRKLNFLIKGKRLGEEKRKRSRVLDGDSW
ncbi:MFS general substrate transporter [Plenodomus tracheiphilus IPT5]|uniref:MFS general substrate transporter n=1 Tax=Plenodomus tracheiphilus IPT5 TaxID=1408161 RepID=A0A6A7BGH2_9PLEO|nr:MFS general substrate transporter [Plenodomus tracheiphilus IPT5]